jgi:hypothetical protein
VFHVQLVRLNVLITLIDCCEFIDHSAILEDYTSYSINFVSWTLGCHASNVLVLPTVDWWLANLG